MNYSKKRAAAIAAAVLLLGMGGVPASNASAEPSGLLPAASVNNVAQTSMDDALAQRKQLLTKFKPLLDQQRKALDEEYKPGEIRYVYINDKEFQASSIGGTISSDSYLLMFQKYDEYTKKYAAGKSPMPLKLQQTPEGYNFFTAKIAPFMSRTEQKALYNQLIAEGKASGKKIYVKKLQEKRVSIELIYTMAVPVNEITGVLTITAEPAGPADKGVASEEVTAQSQKLKVGSQEVIYTLKEKQEYKSVAWMNPKTRINYIIRENRGHWTKEQLLELAGQVMAQSK
ncbi:hypothetical protein [Paenibacillus sp. MMS20-IR301]|uniref:hypothetical protein n=1 Tax=Paenibacillus sp. MMS20-IR301 TaxID=2895946 RepID=UPI0028E1D181|nr:hypothetical protein [Paenibacillus sp. MMS20-IR301]WNS40713.1 hypothetical protein LOS79_16770 [Paenibacillus sp. MMS20-IR301]